MQTKKQLREKKNRRDFFYQKVEFLVKSTRWNKKAIRKKRRK